jgi:AmiR/NasT family two-component response regulator
MGNGNSGYAQVIDLTEVRRRALRSHVVWYITENRVWSDLLASFSFFQLEEIQSREELNSRLLIKRPSLILVESAVRWAHAVEVIEELQEFLQVPIVMIYDPREKNTDPHLVKKAYAAGVCDTLYTPLHNHELSETLALLLKFQKQISNQK